MSTLKTERIEINATAIQAARALPVEAPVHLRLLASDGTEVPLPTEVERILLDTLRAVARHGGVSIGQTPQEITSTSAAALLGVSRPTVMKWAQSGDLPSFKVGSHTRFRRDDVLQLRSKRQQEQRKAFEELRAFDLDHMDLFED